MASNDEIDKLLLEGVDDIDKENATQPKGASRNTPVTEIERLVLQNLFDTQPEKRRAYLKQLGFEIDPKNDNNYRPLGSTQGYAEIDPGVKAYFKKGGLKELGKDVGDVLFDLAVNTPLVGASASAGAAGGAAFGTGLAPVAGTAVGGIAGLVGGGAAGNVASEEIKNFAADVFLDENVPQDQKLTLIQSAISGMVPALLKGAGKFAKGVVSAQLSKRRDAMINAIKSAGGQVTPELMERAAKNPEQFTKEAVKGASERLNKLQENIFGVAEDKVFNPSSTRQIKPGSVFGNAMKPLNEAADNELTRLGADPSANWKLGEIVQPMRSAIEAINNKPFSERTGADKVSLDWLKKKLADFEKDYGVGTALGKNDQVEINFVKGRNVLKSVQDELWTQKGADPDYGSIRSMFGGQESGGMGLRLLADQKAARAGSDLAQINAKRSAILDLYKTGRNDLKVENLTKAFIGDDSGAKAKIRKTVGLADQLLGTNIAEDAELTAVQRLVENAYAAPKNAGSMRTNVLAEGIGEGLKQGGIGLAIGGATTPFVGPAGPIAGAGIGFAKGFRQGAQNARALASPEMALQKVIQDTNKLAIAQAPTTTAAELLAPKAPALAAAATQGVAQIGANKLAETVAPAIKPKLFGLSEEEINRMLLDGVE
jgi:hypothetical protein